MRSKLFYATLILTMLLLSRSAEAQLRIYPEGTEPKVAAGTITSELEMEVMVCDGQELIEIAKAPGTLKIPQCTRRVFMLTGLNEKNVEAYVKEARRLEMRHVVLMEMNDARLKAYAQAGLFTNLEGLHLGGEDAKNGKLTDISPVTQFQKLNSLGLWCCDDLKDITPLAKLQNLTWVGILECENLKDITPLTKLPKLTALAIDSSGLTDLTTLAKLQNLTSLAATMPDEVTDITPLAKLENLTSLLIDKCKNLNNITPLTKLKKLTALGITGSEKLKDIAPLAALSKLHTLDLTGCKEIQNIQPLAWMPDLKNLNLARCEKISSFHPLTGLKKLEILSLTIPNNDLAFLRNLQQLQELHFSDCPKLSNVAPLKNLQKLETLGFSGCDLVTQAALTELKKKLPKGCEVTRN